MGLGSWMGGAVSTNTLCHYYLCWHSWSCWIGLVPGKSKLREAVNSFHYFLQSTSIFTNVLPCSYKLKLILGGLKYILENLVKRGWLMLLLSVSSLFKGGTLSLNRSLGLQLFVAILYEFGILNQRPQHWETPCCFQLYIPIHSDRCWILQTLLISKMVLFHISLLEELKYQVCS